MATYLVLCNRVLNAINEVELTSANFSSSRGIQTSKIYQQSITRYL